MALAGAAATAFAAMPPATVDLAAEPIKDQRQLRAGTGCGYAGHISMLDKRYCDEFLVKHPDETWKRLAEGGAYVVREWSANDRWQACMALKAAKTAAERDAVVKRYGGIACADPRVVWDFRKRHGIRALLTLENYSVIVDTKTGRRSDDIKDVKRVICDFVHWLVANGYKNQVIGFELSNEPYWGNNPERNAARWAEIVPEIKKIFPEVDIGFPIAEYRAFDPDVAAVRRRSTATDKWFKDQGYYAFSRLNQWSGRFIVAFSNAIDQCSHVIYHFYGGYRSEAVGPSGFSRIHAFAQAFPEVKGKKVWISEWRERSDEDNHCHQSFGSALTKAHYLLSTTASPMVDCTSTHQLSCLAGGFYIADGKGDWVVQWAEHDEGRGYGDPDATGVPRIEIGPAGPVYRLYNEALMKHPLILDTGVWRERIRGEKLCSGVLFYESTDRVKAWYANGCKGKRPEMRGGEQWVLACNPRRTSAVFLIANSVEAYPWPMEFNYKGYRPRGKARCRFYRCRPEDVVMRHIPGEKSLAWMEEKTMEFGKIVIPSMCVATVEFDIEEAK